MKRICYVVSSTADDKVYVGYTGKSLERRLSQHFRDARNGSRLVLHRAMRKHGFECFSIRVLEAFDNREEALNAECRYIQELNSIAPRGYNMTPGGDGCVDLCDESKSRKSKSAIKRHADPEYKKRHRKGCRASWDDKRREHMSSVLRGRKMHPNTAAAIREAKKTDEYREIARIAAKRTWEQPGYKEAWIQAKLEKHILKAKRFPMRDDGLIFSSTRSAANHMKNEGHEKAAPNNICLACNGKYKTSYGHHWSWINGDDAREQGGILS